MGVEKITWCGFDIRNVSVVPAKGLVVEPRSIKPVTGRTTMSTGPFLMWVGDVKRSFSVVLVVLVFGSRKTWKEGRIHCIHVNVGGGSWGPSGPSGRATTS